MKERIAIIDGVRTPMASAGGVMKSIPADDLAAFTVRELLYRLPFKTPDIDEFILGNVAQPSNAANIARVAALKGGLPESIPAFTVHRNCASGMEAVTSGANKILAGESQIILCGGAESMSNIPFFYNTKMKDFFTRLSKAKTFFARLGAIFNFRFKNLKPEIGLLQGLTDPVSGMIMGMTAEVLAGEFRISRERQDLFALESHRKAVDAITAGRLAEEITPVPLFPGYDKIITVDQSPRANQSMEALKKLRPYFDRKNGTVTVGNSCPVTDGAAAVAIMAESKAKELGIQPLGFLRDYAYASLEPQRMGLGPVYATSKLLEKSGALMGDFKLIELNEAFAAQVLANIEAFPSKAFGEKYLNRTSPVGELNPEILNVNGGAIALGHPVGMTGTRLIITLLKEMRRRNLNCGLATLCVGGGQGAALFLEVT